MRLLGRVGLSLLFGAAAVAVVIGLTLLPALADAATWTLYPGLLIAWALGFSLYDAPYVAVPISWLLWSAGIFLLLLLRERWMTRRVEQAPQPDKPRL